jgi:hypothetical protein
MYVGAAGAVEQAKKLFDADSHPTTRDWCSINLETNCGDHTVQHMLEDSKDMNDWFRYVNLPGTGRLLLV